MDPIPADECRTLEAIIKDDLQRAEILSVSVYVDEDGSIEVEELALKRKHIIAAKAKKNLVTSTGGATPRPCQNSDKAAIDTKKELAKIAGVSHDTIARVEKIVQKAPEMRSKAPVIALEINPGDGWRDMTVEEDYSEELEELTAEPWHPEPPEPWDRE